VGDRAVFHHFPAVVPEAQEPEDRVGVQAPDPAAYPDSTVVILECFDRDATKWSGVRLIADQRGIRPERTCAIGDQINDIPMLRGAGLAVAMGNAVLPVRDLAHRTTLSNAHDGVAYAIDQILRGHW
jgi:hydroxymethylpyrimidine pyrophosphatase-like HAD family hydrolase